MTFPENGSEPVGKLLKPVAALVTALTGAMLKQISSAL